MQRRNRCNCSVYGCMRNKLDRNLTFFKLPTDVECRNEWLKRIGRQDLLNKANLKPTSYVVCATHFEDSAMSSQTIRKLLPGAMPTKYLFDPQNYENKNGSENTNPSASSDLSTQTKDSIDFQESYVKMLSVAKINDASTTTASTQTDNPIEEQITQTSTATSSNTSRNRKLSVQLQKSEEHIRKLQRELNKIKHEIEAKNSLSLVPSDDEDHETSNRFYKLLKWQQSVRNSCRGELGAGFKFFALNLHYSSTHTYRSLRNILKLPSESELAGFKLHIRPEVDNRIFNTITSTLESLPDKAKYCTLCVDKVMLKRNLYYDIKHDEIFGLQNINGNVRKDIVSTAYVVMLRGIAVNWTLPIGYTFLATTEHYQKLDEWMNEVISKLLKTGIKVMAIVSDQESNFDKYAKEFKQVTPEKPYFNFNESKIYYLFDVPHMLNCVRNDLLTNDFYLAGQKISWDYIRKMYLFQKEHNLHLIPNITDEHIDPDNVCKTCVKYAAQIFSGSVNAVLNTFIYSRFLPEDAKPTAEFIIAMNNLFDVLNSSKMKSSNKYQQPLTLNADQIDILETKQKMFGEITVKDRKTGKDNTNSVKTFENFQITIQATMMICKELKQEGVKSVLTRRLNKEPLDNFLNSVRRQGGNSRDRTAIQFTRAFSKQVADNMLKSSSAATCKSDLCDLIIKANNIILEDIQEKQKPSSRSRNSRAVSLNGEVDYRFELPTESAITYISGYLLFKCSQKHQCPEFETYLKNTPELKDSWMFAYYKAVNTRSSFYECLKVPPDNFVKYIQKLETTFFNNFDEVVTNHPGNTLLKLLKSISFRPPCACFPSRYLLKLFVRFRIYSTIKFNNQQFRDGKKNVRYIEAQEL